MQFSDTTNKNGIIQRCEDYAGFDDGVISSDDTLLRKFTANINETLYDLTTEIILSNDQFDFDDPTKTDYPIATTPLVAGQRDYQFDNIGFLRLKRVDVSYDGTNFYRATPFDSGAVADGLGNDSKIDEKFTKTEPAYDPKAFGFWLYPRAEAADVSAGGTIRIEYERTFTEFAYNDTTKEPPIDRPFRDLIAAGAVLKWPNLSDNAYAKARAVFGEKIVSPGGRVTYTGGLSRLIGHYNNRNEDEQLVFRTNLLSDYK